MVAAASGEPSHSSTLSQMARTRYTASNSAWKAPVTTKKTHHLHFYCHISNRHSNNSKGIIHLDHPVPNSSNSIFIQRFPHIPSKAINAATQHSLFNSNTTFEHTISSSKAETTAAIHNIILMRAKWTRRPQEKVKEVHDPRRKEGGNSKRGGSGVEKEEERVGGRGAREKSK